MKLTWLGCWVFWYRWLRQAAVFLTGFGNQFVAVLQEFIQFGGFDFELGNYSNHNDSLVLFGWMIGNI